jgi:hypothetical protein
MEQQKRGRGRPPIPADERLEQRSIRLTAEQWASVDAHGIAWLRKLLSSTSQTPSDTAFHLPAGE